MRSDLGLLPKDIAILMPARFSVQKDFATFLKAAALALRQNSRLRFLAAGKGVSPEALLRLIPADLPVTALGDREDILQVLQGMDAVTLSSSFGEGCPNAIGEAMAAGIPAIATDAGGIAELVAALASSSGGRPRSSGASLSALCRTCS